ncbi:hypothetical protein E3N88_23251 [Mikania micrantha]|uniref:Transposase, Ptta/En/Spm, plant n=1 Tax=Mikania micrantha TaxID=192012 RepID=A0A5N6NEI7_9ASTR|nr:hypothetical protein E3N88_23251 [Mikania micrantha]
MWWCSSYNLLLLQVLGGSQASKLQWRSSMASQGSNQSASADWEEKWPRGVQNVDNDLAEDLDVVHNNSSSNSVLCIDLSQYFQTRSTHVSNNEAASEVNPPAVFADEDEMFQGELIMMRTIRIITRRDLKQAPKIMGENVMQGRGHGGDGAEDPPPPGGFGRGHHEADFDAPRKTRGKAKNKKLTHAVSLSGRPLTIPFDVNATFTPVGELNDWFTREVGIYMWEHIAFDKTSWKYVSSAEKNALYEHLKLSFDLDEIERGCESAQKKGGIEAALLKRYRDRKAMAKQHFIKNGGYDDEERVRANPPEGMYAENWKKAVDFFLSDTHKKRSSSNAEVRQKQLYTNRGGTSAYSSYCYKNNKSRLEAFHNAHTGKDETFDSEVAERHYNDLKEEFQNQIGPNSDGEFDEESSASHPNEVAVFEKVIGVRRRHTRGIGRKPSISDG